MNAHIHTRTHTNNTFSHHCHQISLSHRVQIDGYPVEATAVPTPASTMHLHPAMRYITIVSADAAKMMLDPVVRSTTRQSGSPDTRALAAGHHVGKR